MSEETGKRKRPSKLITFLPLAGHYFVLCFEDLKYSFLLAAHNRLFNPRMVELAPLASIAGSRMFAGICTDVIFPLAFRHFQ
jgi:hypothetical protein